MRTHFVVFVAAFLTLAGGSAQPTGSQRAPDPSAAFGDKTKLVLMISIDQMRFDYLERFAPLYKGGLNTLTQRGAVFTNANYRHAATETGPGHSVLLTGSHPSHSGIVANEWYDSYLKRAINVVDDPVQNPVGGTGRAASPANLQTFTVGDALKSTQPQSRVIGVSLKDRSAILMGGRRADAAYWLETDGRFITSTYYAHSAPPWLDEWNRKRKADRFASADWTRLLDDPAIYEKYAGKDAVETERDGKDITFPHRFAAKPPEAEYYVELRRTPFADDLTLEFALEAMRRHELGKDDATDILAVGFAATDGVGHAYGPDSHEAMDQLLRVDRLLAQLLQHVDETVGLDRTLVILSADHGSRPLVEVSRARGIDARRVAPSVLENAVKAAFEKKFPGVTNLISYFATDFYFNKETIAQHKLDWSEVEKTAIAALLATGIVEHVYTQDDLRSTAPSTDPFLPLFRNAFFEPRSPHLTLLLKREINLNASATGTGHGSAYEFDRHVPVIFMGKHVVPGRYEQASGPEDIAPTLAHLLQLTFPHERDTRVLLEALQ